MAKKHDRSSFAPAKTSDANLSNDSTPTSISKERKTEDAESLKKQRTEPLMCFDGKDCQRNKCKYAHPSYSPRRHNILEVHYRGQTHQQSTDLFRTSILLQIKGTDSWMRMEHILQDTGATISLISQTAATNLGFTIQNKDRSILLFSAHGKRMKHSGQLDLIIKFQGIVRPLTVRVLVVKNLKEDFIIGADLLNNLGAKLVYDVNSVDLHEDPSIIADILWTPEMLKIRDELLKNSAIKHAPPSNIRPVEIDFIGDPFASPNIRVKPEIPPQAWREEIDRTHRELLEAGLISPVDPKDVHNPVRTHFVKETDKIRWATNLKSKNQFIRRQHHPLPSVEHLIKEIASKKILFKN